MVGKAADTDAEITGADTAAVQNVADLARLLRQLRRREARRRNDSPLSYRELAAKTGWSHSAVALYLNGQALASTDRFDILIQLLGAAPAEQGLLATARDRIEERRYAEPGGEARPPDRGRGPIPVTPHTLPAPTPFFTGRHAELRTLTGLMRAQADAGGTVLITAIGGTAGVGKTALAVYWAHRVADRFPDGQLYVNLRGFDPGEQSMDPGAAVRYFLEALHVPLKSIPSTLDGQSALYRSLLSGRRMLIVLDNARDTGQVRPLLPGTPGCLVLVTSRNRLSGLVATDGAHPITLDLLTEDEAGEYFTRRLPHDRFAAEPDTVREIIAHCARLPLALAIVAGRAATNPRLPLRAIAAELGDSHRRWAALRGDDPATDVRAVFSWSYRALSPAAARLFRLLGLHPGPDFSAAAAASLAAVSPADVPTLLAELSGAHLIVEQAAGRYALHDLLRAYAAEQVRADPEHLDATHRMLDHYLHSSYAAERLLNDGEPVALDPPVPGVSPESPADQAQALAWFGAELRVLLAAIDRSHEAFGSHVWRLNGLLGLYLDRRGLWHEWIAAGRSALAAAQRAGDARAQATTHRHLARAHTAVGHADDALEHLRHALDILVAQGDVKGQAHTHLALSDMAAGRGDNPGALDHAKRALEHYVAADSLRGQADALNSVGWYHALLGDYGQTITHCERALELHRQIGRPGIVEATTWDSLAYAHHHLGDHDRAVACYQRAIELFQGLGDRYFQAETLSHLGDTHRAAGNPEAAQEVWQRALSILEDLGHPGAAGVRAKLSAP